MLEDFFQYSKLSSGDVKVSGTKFQLNELLRQFKEDEEEKFEEHHLNLVLNLFKHPIECYGDSELIARAISNLLENALKYAKENTVVTIRSRTQIVEQESFAVFSISNVLKKKMTEEERELLFERLYKRDPARSETGSGLGLSIVKEIAELHGGTAEAELQGEEIQMIVQIPFKEK